jgi:hypothetical protein
VRVRGLIRASPPVSTAAAAAAPTPCPMSSGCKPVWYDVPFAIAVLAVMPRLDPAFTQVIIQLVLKDGWTKSGDQEGVEVRGVSTWYRLALSLGAGVALYPVMGLVVVVQGFVLSDLLRVLHEAECPGVPIPGR